MIGVDLLVSKRAVHVTVIDTEAVALSLGFRVHKLVDALNCLGQVSADRTHKLEELVFVETCGHPEGYVLVTGGEFRVGLKL